MTKLPESFTSRGHIHKLVKRTAPNRKRQYAIYQRWPLNAWPSPNPHYEVIRILQQEAGTISKGGADIHMEAKELYPNETKWGKHGWTYLSKRAAEEKFRMLQNRTPTTT